MAKAKRRTAPARPQPVAPAQDRVIAGIAAVGLLIALYLTGTKLAQGTALFCTEGGGCDVVQASRYATFFWVPTALWGAVVYAAIGGLALAGLTADRWLWAFLLAVGGVSFSAYLTWIAATEIRAMCGWCLASGATAVALLVALYLRRPAPAPGRTKLRGRQLAGYTALVAVATVVGGAFVYAGSPSSAEAMYRDALARHLTQQGAVMYGAFWCSACAEQKARFGGAARLIPYVECDAKGAGARPDLCSQVGVRKFPTWVIGGEKLEGVQTLEQLAASSKFAKPGG